MIVLAGWNFVPTSDFAKPGAGVERARGPRVLEQGTGFYRLLITSHHSLLVKESERQKTPRDRCAPGSILRRALCLPAAAARHGTALVHATREDQSSGLKFKPIFAIHDSEAKVYGRPV